MRADVCAFPATGLATWRWCIGSNLKRAPDADVRFGRAIGEQLGDTEYKPAWRAVLDAEVAAEWWRASVGRRNH